MSKSLDPQFHAFDDAPLTVLALSRFELLCRGPRLNILIALRTFFGLKTVVQKLLALRLERLFHCPSAGNKFAKLADEIVP